MVAVGVVIVFEDFVSIAVVVDIVVAILASMERVFSSVFSVFFLLDQYRVTQILNRKKNNKKPPVAINHPERWVPEHSKRQNKVRN